MGAIDRRIDRLEKMLNTPDIATIDPATVEALDTAGSIIAERGTDVEWLQNERMREGESYQDALVQAKREILAQGEEGRRALVVMDALRRGRES